MLTRPEAQDQADPITAPSPGRVRATRLLQYAYAVMAAVLGLILLADGGIVRVATAAGLLVVGAVSVVLGVGLPRWRWVRPVVVVLHSVLVAVLFGLGILSAWLNALQVASVVILVLLRPSFPQLVPRSRKLWLTLHVGISVGWLGVSLVMVVLNLAGIRTGDLHARHHAFALMDLVSTSLVIPLALGSILTGLVVSLGTKWGLVRHWWVLAKLGIALGIVTFAGVKENFWLRELVAKTAEDPAVELYGVDVSLAVTMVAFCVGLWTATVLSVYKPWGRTRWGVREQGRRRARAAAAAQADR